ncbi:hypothetical protein PspLS_06204 [Pyricularia sp. CBS 133598]|nr:hypothetical protein PspLS_06204 [Pyricularia sp. CBS 133598]
MSKTARRSSQIVSVGDGSFPFETSLMPCKCCRYGLSEVGLRAGCGRVGFLLKSPREPLKRPERQDLIPVKPAEQPRREREMCCGSKSCPVKVQSPELIGSFHLEFNVDRLQLNLKFRLFLMYPNRRPDLAWFCPRVLSSKSILARPHYGTVRDTDRPDSTSALTPRLGGCRFYCVMGQEDASVTVQYSTYLHSQLTLLHLAAGIRGLAEAVSSPVCRSTVLSKSAILGIFTRPYF